MLVLVLQVCPSEFFLTATSLMSESLKTLKLTSLTQPLSLELYDCGVIIFILVISNVLSPTWICTKVLSQTVSVACFVCLYFLSHSSDSKNGQIKKKIKCRKGLIHFHSPVSQVQNHTGTNMRRALEPAGLP